MKILSRPKGNAEEYGRWSVNPYIGCSHQCSYCYLKSGPGAKTLGGNVATLKKGVVSDEHAYHLAMAEIIEHREEIIRDGGLFMTFTSDPCAKETRMLFFRIVKECIGNVFTDKQNVVPVTLLTKNADFCPYNVDTVADKNLAYRLRAWIENYFSAELNEGYRDRLAIGFTLTGHDELEPNASPNAERIKAMHWLHKNKYLTWASIEPVIDFESAYDMIEQALAAGCEHFKIGLQTRNTKVIRSQYALQECLDFIGNVMAITEGMATVYWKQSFRDFLGKDLEWHLDNDMHSVDMHYSLFDC
jgi:DNA repair photolyase